MGNDFLGKIEMNMDSIQKSGNNEKERRVERETRPSANCYCGKDRNLNIVELLCQSCNKFYHESCIGYQLGKLLPFSMNYTFVCKNCSPTGLETYRKVPASITQMCMTAIANMQQASVKDGNVRYKFSRDQEIIPYIEQYWDAITTMPRRVTQSWYATVQRALTKDVQTLFTFEETKNGPMFGIARELTSIKPEGTVNAAQNVNKAGGRQNKRKFPGSDTGPTGKKGRPGTGDLSGNVKLPAHGYPLEHPFNKDGYRYILAEPDPHAPFRQEFDESSDCAGKPIPGWLYRTLSPNAVYLALHDRAMQLKISDDRLSVTGEKGYCMVRGTHFVSRGSWYFEMRVDEMPEGSAVRVGWGQEYSNLQAPLGYDKFGYSWRSRKGTRFHESHGKHFSEGYGEGDVVGYLIELPEEAATSYLPNTYKDRPLVKFKSHLYYEDKDKVSDTLKRLRALPGSRISFFKNGVHQGVAFTDIYAGCYYPSVSLHKNVKVTMNFGPNFKNPNVEKEFNCKGLCRRVEELICEQSLADMLFFTENEGKLRLDS